MEKTCNNWQQFLAKQGKYLEAQDIKKIGDQMEHNELQETLAAYQAEVALKEQSLRAKQQIEMEVLLQRAAQGRDELRKTRVLDIERCHQVRIFFSLQRLDFIWFEKYMYGQCSDLPSLRFASTWKRIVLVNWLEVLQPYSCCIDFLVWHASQ